MRIKLVLRTIRNFILVLFLSLLVMYCSAIYSDQSTKNKQQRSTERIQKANARLTTPQIMRIKTQGFASYIGMESNQFEEKFGRPEATMDSAINVKWLLYNLDSSNYLKVGIDQYTQKICSIVVVGNLVSNNSKLRVGMSFKQLLRLSTLYANFEVSYREENFQFELSENDLNNHPLIGFTNGSYVIPYLQPNSKRVIALEFLDTGMLLKKNIYQIISRTPIPSQYQGETNWNQLDIMVPYDLMQVINTKRRILANTTLPVGDPLTQSAQRIISVLEKNPKRYLRASHANLLEDITSGDVGQNRFLSLSQGSFSKKLYQDVDLNTKNFEMYVIFPFYNATTFFEKTKLQQNVWDSLIASKTKKIGIAYDQGLLVIIINKGGN
ncbi:MAG: CAP-associated domain-containing protein [Liquorilactobacillus sp.]|uniref:CAP-associated domain-containing protein n=1 Tax=Liquorilactobacillus sp. TaxID=2767923 RepID=UPI0039E7D6C5